MRIEKGTLDGWLANPANTDKIIAIGPADTPPEEGQVFLPTDTAGNFVHGILPHIARKVIRDDDGRALVHVRSIPEGAAFADGEAIYAAFADGCITAHWATTAEEHARLYAEGHPQAWLTAHTPLPNGIPARVRDNAVSNMNGRIGGLHTQTGKYPPDKTLGCLTLSNRPATLRMAQAYLGQASFAIQEAVFPACRNAGSPLCDRLCHTCARFDNKPTPGVF